MLADAKDDENIPSEVVLRQDSNSTKEIKNTMN